MVANVGYSMMGGWGASWAGLFGSAFFIVWFIVGVFAAIWLWRQINKR
ncbi:MAG: hypothetical protein HYS44_00840 [Candidatus Niyogibacteria bacterium]|nr:hypothetical protein [Candidatus Niyogibacteria bacterium]